MVLRVSQVVIKKEESKMGWICSKCKTKNTNTNICTKCGFDESRNYARYATIAVLQEKDKADFRKMIFKGDNILMACPDTNLVFGKEMDRSKIKSIEIYNTLSKANESAWDVSAHKDGSVLAWVVEDEDGWKHLKLAAEGDIIANGNCNCLFSNFNRVEYIEGLQYLNTENVTNMSSMFDSCKKLQSLDISKFDTRNVTDINHMFCSCRSLKTLDVNNFDTVNVTDMSGMFFACESLQMLNVNKFNTKNVTDMRYMFSYCKRLKKLDIRNVNTEKVLYMGDMFSQCSSLEELDISGFDTSNVINMKFMFWNCKSLIKLNLRKLNTKKVTNMNHMFGGCESLQRLDVSAFDTRNVTEMGSMFSGCESLQSLNLGNFDTKNVTDMSYMFYNCKNLQNLNVNSFNVENVMDMSNMFWNCKKFLKKQNVTDMKEIPTDLQELQCDNDTENVIDTNKKLFKEGNILMACWDFSLVFWKKMNRSEIRSIQIYNTLSAATKSAWDISVNKDRSVLAWVVNDQNGWKHLKLAAEGEIIASEDCSYMFSFYDKVEHIEGFQYLNTGNVTNMSCMFLNCKSLQKLDLSNFDTRNVTNMSHMFSNCRSLSKPDISSFDMSKVVDKEDMFKNCKE